MREWFHNVRSANGIPCCDIADGHRTDFDMRQNLYWVPINGNWMRVPPDAVLKNAGNPTGGAVVWYSDYGGQIFIRCFVPGDRRLIRPRDGRSISKNLNIGGKLLIEPGQNAL